jgi:DNA-binding protein Fis
MQHTNCNKTRTAKLLGKGKPTPLSNSLRKHGVEP